MNRNYSFLNPVGEGMETFAAQLLISGGLVITPNSTLVMRFKSGLDNTKFCKQLLQAYFQLGKRCPQNKNLSNL
jgi:hypothetical protein